MSHVAVQETKAGEPLFVDLACLERAAEIKGLEVVHTSKYNWYGQSLGDYPVPKGRDVNKLGNDAMFILRIKEPKRSELTAQNGHEPYDIGVIEDPKNPGCYTVMYDHFIGGYGLDELVGGPVYDDNYQVKMLAPLLKQAYDIVCDVEAAKEVGDHIEVLTLKQASEKYPQQFPKSSDESTWVSIANTQERIREFH